MRLAVLASHEGTTLQAVMDACADGHLDAEVCLVVSNNSTSGAMQRAQTAGVPTEHISGKTHPDENEADDALLNALQSARADWVLSTVQRIGSYKCTHFGACDRVKAPDG